MAFLLFFPTLGALQITINRDGYIDGIFTVHDAVYQKQRKSHSVYLVGNVNNTNELFTPSELKNCNDRNCILSMFPIGVKIDVLYNSAVTATLLQGSSIRVLKKNHDFDASFWWLFMYVILLFLPSLYMIFYGYKNAGSIFRMRPSPERRQASSLI